MASVPPRGFGSRLPPGVKPTGKLGLPVVLNDPAYMAALARLPEHRGSIAGQLAGFGLGTAGLRLSIVRVRRQ